MSSQTLVARVSTNRTVVAVIGETASVIDGRRKVVVVATGATGPAGGGSSSGLPAGGTVGQVVTNTGPGTGDWEDPSGAVASVNGQTGVVVLGASDVGADAAGAAAIAQAAAIAASQPVDSDLTAIAALATTAYGRSLLTQADAAALRTTAGLGTSATHAATDFDAAGAAAAAQAASQPLDSDLTAIAALTTTTFGRSLLTLADAAAGRTAFGLGTVSTLASDTDGTLAANSDANISTQKAVKTYVDAHIGSTTWGSITGTLSSQTDLNTALGTKPTAVLDTDGTLAANSDANVPSQKAVRTLVDLLRSNFTTINVGFAGITVPRRALDRWRGAQRPNRTYLKTALTDTTGTTVVPGSHNFTRTGVNDVIQIDSEQMLVTGGQRTLSLTVVRGVNGTTAATHSAGAPILTSGVRNVVCIGDSTVQGSTSSLTDSNGNADSWDCWVDRVRRVMNQRFGGSLGHGLVPMWRSHGQTVGGASNANTAPDWTFTGTWSIATGANTYYLFPDWNVFSTNSGTATWTRPPGVQVAQIDVFWVDVTGVANAWSYSVDGGSTWVNNPNTATGPATSTLKKTSVVVSNPTDFRVRCANAAGTQSTSIFCAIDVWSTVPVFGVTTGVKVHNLGIDGYTLAQFVVAASFDDLVTTSGSTTATSNTAGFSSSMTGEKIVGDNVPAGTTFTYVSATQITLSTSVGVTTGTGVATRQGLTAGGDNFRILDGDAASLVPDLLICGPWTNDMSQFASGSGSRAVTGTITSTTALQVTSGTLYAGDTGKVVSGTGIPAGTTITFVDSTHATLSGACTNGSGLSIGIGALSATITKGFQNNLTTLYNRVNPYADILFINAYEQGSDRLTGASSTSSKQADYRAALKTTAAAKLQTVLDIYDAWSAEGNTGYAAAAADGLIDTSDTSGYHEGAVGHRDMAARITRLLEMF